MYKLFLCVVATALVSACAVTPDRTGAATDIVATDHWVQTASFHDGSPVKLYIREKHARSLDLAGVGKSRNAVLFAHGAGTPGSVIFDLQVPGATGTTYSMMDYLATRGFDVFAIDYQNYGRSDKHACGLCVGADKAVLDLDAAIEHIRKLRGVDKVHLLGWSWGANIVGIAAARFPEKIDRIVMYAAPLWTMPQGDEPKEHFRKVSERDVRGLFEPAASDEAAVDAMVKEVAQWGPTAPNGVIMDLRRRMPLNDPKAISRPTMIIYGALDRLAPVKEANLPVFFMALPNADKQLIIIPGAGHLLTVQKQRLRLYQEAAKWFSVQ